MGHTLEATPQRLHHHLRRPSAVRTGPYGTTCITRWWWGAPLITQNVGAGSVIVWTR